MGAVMLIFWGLVAWVVVTLVRQGDSGGETRGAREILDERYARGEIDDDEYRRRTELIRRWILEASNRRPGLQAENEPAEPILDPRRRQP
jgi:hypothetical protein